MADDAMLTIRPKVWRSDQRIYLLTARERGLLMEWLCLGTTVTPPFRRGMAVPSGEREMHHLIRAERQVYETLRDGLLALGTLVRVIIDGEECLTVAPDLLKSLTGREG